jgi:hypothetical protein
MYCYLAQNGCGELITKTTVLPDIYNAVERAQIDRQKLIKLKNTESV